MRIAIISNVGGYSWSGSEELWMGMAMRALQKGHQVTACLQKELHSGSPIPAFLDAGGCLCEWKNGFFSRFTSVRKTFYSSRFKKVLGSSDVIVISLGSLPSILYVHGLLDYVLETKIPVNVICQFNSDVLPISPKERQAVHKLLNQSTNIVFVSSHNRSLARRQFELPLNDAKVIYNPVRINLNEPLPFRPNTEQVVFACVARMDTLWKGQDLLLEILAREEWRKRSWKLHFFGVGPDLEHVKSFARICGLEDRVFFKGYERDLQTIWGEADMMLLPSRGEGIALSILEAMMCGRPVVTTNVGGNEEIIEDGRSGFIAEAATSRLFGEAMERAWIARDSWPTIGRAAHHSVKKLSASDPENQLLSVVSDSILNKQNSYSFSAKIISSKRCYHHSSDVAVDRPSPVEKISQVPSLPLQKVFKSADDDQFHRKSIIKSICFITTKSSPETGSENLWVASACFAAQHKMEVIACVPNEWIGSNSAKLMLKRGVSLRFRNASQAGLAARLFAHFYNINTKIAKWHYLQTWKNPTRISENIPDMYVINQGGIYDSSYLPGFIPWIINQNSPYVLNVRSGRSLPGIMPNETRTKMNAFYRHASAVIVPTESNIHDIESELLCNLTRTKVVHSPIKNLTYPIPEWPKSKTLSFACISRLEISEKGLDLVIEAAGLMKSRGHQFTISIFGTGPDEEYLRDMIEYHELKNLLFLRGSYESLEELWKTHHVCVLVSRSEGMPQTLMEAMTAGRPSIVTAVGGMAHAVTDEQTGFIANDTTIAEVASAFERCFANRERLQSMGVKCRERALTIFEKNPEEIFINALLNIS